MVKTLGQQYNVGEKPTVILYTNITVHLHKSPCRDSRRKLKQCSTNIVANNVLFHRM